MTEQTVSKWREITNGRMAGVDCAVTLPSSEEKKILSSGGAYFVHDNGTLLGIGWMKNTELLLLAGVKPGAGEKVMHSLMSLAEGASVSLNVASTNTRAIHLYEKLGFVKTAVISTWYEVG